MERPVRRDDWREVYDPRSDRGKQGRTGRRASSQGALASPRARPISHNANGNTRERRGRRVTCEHDARRVTRTEYDGAIIAPADPSDGKPLNSPNGTVCKSDGSVFNPAGKPSGGIDLPERCANIYFGGRPRNGLLMSANM